MRVENTAEGWRKFADQSLKTLKPGESGSLKAETYITGELDPAQLSALQYSLIEFDRIEIIRRRQDEKSLTIYTQSTEDAYRVLHYLWIIAKLRGKLTISVYANDQQVGEAREEKWSVPLGRIFPLLCIGTTRQNRSIASYDMFVSPRDPERLKERMTQLFENGKLTAPQVEQDPTVSVVDFIEYYYLGRLRRAFSDMSGTPTNRLDSESRRKIQQELQKLLLDYLPRLGLLARMLWITSLWAMALSKDLLQLNADKTWSLNVETVQCSRLDAISYAEGLQQLVENACLHSYMRRAYLSIRIHHTDISGTGLQTLAHTVAVRTALNERIKQVASLQADEPMYSLKDSAKYYFEFQVLNDSVAFIDKAASLQESKPRGIAEKYFVNLGLTWPPKTPYTLGEIFKEQLLSPERRQDPMHISQHYGLRVLEKTVLLNDGYLHVISPGLTPEGVAVVDRYQSFRQSQGAGRPFMRRIGENRFTSYFILLPIVPRWNDAARDSASESSSCPQELFDRCALSTPYSQLVLRLHTDRISQLGESADCFTAETHIQGSKVVPLVAAVPIPTTAGDKVKMVERLCKAFEGRLADMDERTICLLDLMQVRDYGLVELLAKMLFMSIMHRALSCEGPTLFALLLPAKEYIWEFIRIFSIFYDKLEGNPAMAHTQVALCGYSEEHEETANVPEVSFLLAGGNTSSALATARIFAYYNTGATVEMIPQLRYLTRTDFGAEGAVPQFPFDLFLTATEDEEGKSWFLRKMEYHLQRDLWRQEHGCRIHGVKVRLKSNIFLSDFYEAELLFHNIGIIYRFAYLIARDILRQMENTPTECLVLVGYEFYSSVLIEQLTALLNQERDLENEPPVHYLIYSEQSGTEHSLHFSPELQDIEDSERTELMKKAKYLAVVPIGTTLSTVYHVQRAVEAYTGVCGRFTYENYTLVLVGCTENGNVPLSERYWKHLNEKTAELPGLVRLEKRERSYSQAMVRFFLEPRADWKESNETDTEHPLEEQVLVYVDQTSTIPKDIFVGEKTRFRGISELILQGTESWKENDRRAALLKGCIYYGHLAAGNNHFQFYLDVDRYFAKANQLSDSATSEKKSINMWLRELRKTIKSDAYNIIVSPLHQEDSPFAKAVADQVFEHSLRFLHVDFSGAFREDIRAKFSYIAKEYAKIKRFDRGKSVNVYFVNTAITSGATLLRARNLMMMLLEESSMEYDRGNIFKGCFVLINRSGYDTINSYVDQPQRNFHAYVHLAVPSLNIRNNFCPTCELVEQYRTIEQRCASNQLRREFHRLAEKHTKRDVHQYVNWLRHMVMVRSGYANWLRQWLFANVRGKKPPKPGCTVSVGIFSDVSREEFLRLQQLVHLLKWALEKYLSQYGNDEQLPAGREAYLKTLNAFSLRDLERLVDENQADARRALGGTHDDYCLKVDYWQHVVIDYVCGQKNYIRLMATHNTFLATEQMVDQMKNLSLPERGRHAAELLLNVITKTLKGIDSLDLKYEWIISYLKVMSRPHLAQYHHIRQGILWILLQLADSAIQEEDHRSLDVKGLDSYLRDDPSEVEGRAPIPLLQYQLLQTILKRLAGLQSTYLLREANLTQILEKIDTLRRKYFAEQPYEDFYRVKRAEKSLCMHFNPFPTEEEVSITMAKLVKWASSCGDDENGCYLIEREFKAEVSQDATGV